MAADRLSKVPLGANYQFHYKQFLKDRKSLSEQLRSDPEFMKLYKQYLISLDVYVKAINEACAVFIRETEGTDSRDSKRGLGPRDVRAQEQKLVLYPDLSSAQMPDGGINFYKLETLRRFYERDAYKLFTYRPNIQHPIPPATRRRLVRGYMKDAAGRQWFGDLERSNEKLEAAQKEVEKICEDVLQRYHNSPKPRSEALIKELMEALEITQYTLQDENPVRIKVQDEVDQLDLR